MNEIDLYLLGRTPPPIGGVTSFNLQILELLNTEQRPAVKHIGDPIDLLSSITPVRRKNFLVSISNRPIILLTTIFLRLLRHNVATIIHGDIERGNRHYALLVKAIALFSNYIIVLNESSYRYLHAKQNIILLGTNLAPEQQTICPERPAKRKTHFTYAHRKEFDSDGKDIYGILFLYSYFSKSGAELVILDPSNSYHHLKPLDNIRIYRTPVQVEEFLGPNFIYLRNTSTDGDSLLVHEAMNKGTIVVASDVVSRPPGVLLMGYNSESDLKMQLDIAADYQTPKPTSHYKEWVTFLRKFSNGTTIKAS